jgi:hypothetical protein
MDPLGIIRLFLVILLLSSATNSSNVCTIFMHRGKNPPKRKKAIEDGPSKGKKRNGGTKDSPAKNTRNKQLNIAKNTRSKKKLIVDC